MFPDLSKLGEQAEELRRKIADIHAAQARIEDQNRTILARLDVLLDRIAKEPQNGK